MDQIAKHQRPNVEVTITPELRTLFAGRYDPPGEGEAKEQCASETAAQTTSGRTVTEPAWQTVLVRCDGARPLQFDGVEVFGISGSIGSGSSAFEHDLTLYQDREGRLICALRAAPQDALQRRPTYWCQSIGSAEDFLVLTDRWLRDGLATYSGAEVPTENDCPDHEALSTQFKALTAQSLRTAQSH